MKLDQPKPPQLKSSSKNRQTASARLNNSSNSKHYFMSSNFQTRKSDDTSLPAVPHQTQANTKSFSQHPYWEKEKLYDLCMKLQTSVNLLNHQVKVVKIENHKKEEEINKQKALIKEVEENSKQSPDSSSSTLNSKVRESTLVSNLRQENKRLQSKLQEKEDELNDFKKKVKMTKIKEVAIEVEVYENEMIKMKGKLDNALALAETSSKKDKIIKDYQEKLRRKDQKLAKLQYDNEKIIIASEAKVKELNQEIDCRNRTIVRLEQEISNLKIKEYYAGDEAQKKQHHKQQRKQREKSEEEMKKMQSAKAYQLFIAMKKQELTLESIQSQVIDKINPIDKWEAMKMSFATNLIEMLHITDVNDEASLLDYVTFFWHNGANYNKVSKEVIDSLKELFDKEEKKPKDGDPIELENLVKEKEKKLKYELYKVDSARKGTVTFNTMKEVIQKCGLQSKEKEALIASLKPNSFNTMEYKSLLDLATIAEKFEYLSEEEVDPKQRTSTQPKEEEKRDKQKESTESKPKDEEKKKLKTAETHQQEPKDLIKSHRKDTHDSKSSSSEENNEEDFPSFYQIVYNIKLNEFAASEYFRSIVKQFTNSKSNLEPIEGIKKNEFLQFLKNKDIHIPPEESKRIFKALKCKGIIEKDVIDAQKLETMLAKYMNYSNSSVSNAENKDMMKLIPTSSAEHHKEANNEAQKKQEQGINRKSSNEGSEQNESRDQGEEDMLLFKEELRKRNHPDDD